MLLQRKKSGLQLAYPHPSHKWTVLAVDLMAAAAMLTNSPFEEVKGFQFCSTLLARTFFTSDYKYSLEVSLGDVTVYFPLGVFAGVSPPTGHLKRTHL